MLDTELGANASYRHLVKNKVDSSTAQTNMPGGSKLQIQIYLLCHPLNIIYILHIIANTIELSLTWKSF